MSDDGPVSDIENENREEQGPASRDDSEDGSITSIEDEFEMERVTVFKDETLLHPTNLVDEDRIYGRDKQLNSVIRQLKPALDEVPPKDMILHGPSGTGKSLIIGTVTNKLVKVAERRGYNIAVVKLNCVDIKTEDAAVYNLAKKLARELDVPFDLARKGISTNRKYEHLYDLIREHLDLTIFVLDELDSLVGGRRTNNESPAYSNLLYNLTRATDIADLEHQVTTAVLTNDADSLVQGLDSRTESSFSPREILFDDYDANELRKILHRREDAFRDDVLEDDVIPLTAAYAAQGEGDARKAIDLLHSAGEIADDEESPIVTEEHCREAQTKVEVEYSVREIRNASIQKKTLIFAAALCDLYNDTDIDGVPGQIAHNVYEKIAESEDMDKRSRSRTRVWFNEYVTNSLFTSETKGYGRGKGKHTHYYFQKDPENIRTELVNSDDRLEDVHNDRELFREIVRSEYRWLAS